MKLVRMLKSTRHASSGTENRLFLKGNMYELPEATALTFIQNKWAYACDMLGEPCAFEHAQMHTVFRDMTDALHSSHTPENS